MFTFHVIIRVNLSVKNLTNVILIGLLIEGCWPGKVKAFAPRAPKTRAPQVEKNRNIITKESTRATIITDNEICVTFVVVTMEVNGFEVRQHKCLFGAFCFCLLRKSNCFTDLLMPTNWSALDTKMRTAAHSTQQRAADCCQKCRIPCSPILLGRTRTCVHEKNQRSW